jgi:hypothetical protein
LLKFKVHLISVGDRPTYYLLLPKMTDRQLCAVSERLSSSGYAVKTGTLLRGEKGGLRIAVSRGGVCRSNFDPSDLLLPMIPHLLSFSKQAVPACELLAMYASGRRSGNVLTLRLSARVETSKEWSRLRSADICALSPDEHLVFTTLFKRAGGKVSLLTDYPTESSKVTRPGGRQYYISLLPAAEAARSLRMVGKKGQRNAYLPRNGIIRILRPASESLFTPEVLRELGEWCYFVSDS